MPPDRMNPLDVWFLDGEDGADHLHIGAVGVFEGPPPQYGEVLDLVERKLPLVPRYRQRVRRVPGDLARPVWIDDPGFALTYHVRHTAVPRPGSDAQLRVLAARVMSQPLDHRRPLWEIWLIEGLEGDRWAVLSKVHHCMVDGIAGTDLLALVLSVTADDAPPEWQRWSPEPAPSTAALIRDALTDRATDIARAAGAVVRAPLDARRTLGEVVAGGKGLVAIAGLLRMPPATSLNGPIGPNRRWTWARVDRADIETARAALGGTVNDVVLCAITRGFRELLRARDELSGRDAVRTLVPVSLRGDGARGRLDNRVAAMVASLPVAVADPVERLAAVREEMRRLKVSGEPDATAMFVAASGWTPPGLRRLVMQTATRVVQRTGQRIVNTVTTNVPGPPVPLYLLGRRMEEVYPFVPIAEGVRIGVAIFSYDDAVTFGITGDHDTTPDLDLMASAIEGGVTELVKAAAHRRAAAPPAADRHVTASSR